MGKVVAAATKGPDVALRSLIVKQRSARRWSRAPLVIGGVLVVVIIAICVCRGLLGLPEPNALNLNIPLQAPSWAHPFGTDDVGRDVLSRTLSAVLLDLRVAVELTGMSVLIGVPAGVLAGYFGGVPGAVLMRMADVVLAFPFLVLVIAVAAAVGPGLTAAYIGIPAVGWAYYARLTRAEMLTLKERDFISAARTLGYSTRRVVLKHGLPNVMRPAVVYMTIDVVLNIVALASLSYLGLGVRPPTPELGAIIAEGQQYLLTAWWISTLPGLVLVAIGVGFSLVGDGLASVLDKSVTWTK
jgi:peptide/nickel transport system permease protein